MAERDEIARVVSDNTPASTAFSRRIADDLIANGVRHLPSLADDSAMVDRLSRALYNGNSAYYDDLAPETREQYHDVARDLLRALAASDDT